MQVSDRTGLRIGRSCSQPASGAGALSLVSEHRLAVPTPLLLILVDVGLNMTHPPSLVRMFLYFVSTRQLIRRRGKARHMDCRWRRRYPHVSGCGPLPQPEFPVYIIELVLRVEHDEF